MYLYERLCMKGNLITYIIKNFLVKPVLLLLISSHTSTPFYTTMCSTLFTRISDIALLSISNVKLTKPNTSMQNIQYLVLLYEYIVGKFVGIFNILNMEVYNI